MPKRTSGLRKRARTTKARPRARRRKRTKGKGSLEMPSYLLESHPELGLK